MVWFQCEDCGDMIKKPKLLGHFNRCSAGKLSCVDCGLHFNQQSVQEHKTCISEFDKYGFKGEAGEFLGFSGVKKSVKGGGAISEERLGLSTHPPWKCSLCNVSATSLETLDGHAAGKKHQSKLKAALKARAATEAPAATATTEAEAGAAAGAGNGHALGAVANGNSSQRAATMDASRSTNGAEPGDGDKDGKKKKKKRKGSEEEGKQVEGEDKGSPQQGSGTADDAEAAPSSKGEDADSKNKKKKKKKQKGEEEEEEEEGKEAEADTEFAVEEGRKRKKGAAELKGAVEDASEVKQKAKKQKGELAGGDGRITEEDKAEAGAGTGIAWKPWLKKALKEAPGQQLALKALKKAAWAAAREKDAGLGDDRKKQVLDEMMGVVTKNSSSFKIDRNFVSKM